MKSTCCDICRAVIPEGIHEDDHDPLCIPLFNEFADTYSGTITDQFPDVCPECRRAFAETYASIKKRSQRADVPDTVKWIPYSISPSESGRYLVADNATGKPRVTVAWYYAENDDWATNAAIHPEDIVCWAVIPPAPDYFFPFADTDESAQDE